MIISGEHLKLHYWMTTRSGSGFANYPEVEKGKYGYRLEPGQTISEIRYAGSNQVCAFNCIVEDVDDKYLTVKAHDYYKFVMDGRRMISMSKEDETVIMPWVDDLYNGGELIKCKMQIMPCNTVYQYWPIEDLLTGNVPDQDYEANGKVKEKGRGIWHQHGGWRTISKYEGNLKNFVLMGQQSILGG